ncbi:hypothetical protein TNCV_2097411 [Trichonephila clavipes]|nr:hypothetical protein TNCV_2097411 [Trichonephila clavipes]
MINDEKEQHLNERLQHVILFAFNQDSTSAKAARDICAMFGEGVIPARTAQCFSNATRRATFNTNAELITRLDEFFESKSEDFYQRGGAPETTADDKSSAEIKDQVFFCGKQRSALCCVRQWLEIEMQLNRVICQ